MRLYKVCPVITRHRPGERDESIHLASFYVDKDGPPSGHSWEMDMLDRFNPFRDPHIGYDYSVTEVQIEAAIKCREKHDSKKEASNPPLMDREYKVVLPGYEQKVIKGYLEARRYIWESMPGANCKIPAGPSESDYRTPVVVDDCTWGYLELVPLKRG